MGGGGINVGLYDETNAGAAWLGTARLNKRRSSGTAQEHEVVDILDEVSESQSNRDCRCGALPLAPVGSLEYIALVHGELC